ncbi:MAG: carbonic anhydrase [Candidatus Eremiobacterota bacterium]
MTRRQILQIGACLALAGRARAGTRPTPEQALQLLMQGNDRYVKGRKAADRGPDRRGQTSESQYPIAAILGCADSRVAPEVLFDAGIGELFVVRVAGNIVSQANYGILGSLEYATAVLDTPLIFVLGHSNCGAVAAALKSIQEEQELPGAIEGIVEAIRPAARRSPGLEPAIAENVRLGVERLPQKSVILHQRVAQGKLKLAGGVYDLASGKVTPV